MQPQLGEPVLSSDRVERVRNQRTRTKPVRRARSETIFEIMKKTVVTADHLELTADAPQLAEGLDLELLPYVDGSETHKVVFAWGADTERHGQMWRHRDALVRRVASFVDRGMAVPLAQEE